MVGGLRFQVLSTESSARTAKLSDNGELRNAGGKTELYFLNGPLVVQLTAASCTSLADY